MSDNPDIPPIAQPGPGDVAFDLDGTIEAVVALRARIPEDAFTASILGTERTGHGVVVDRSGLVLTIGYLVTEAEDIWLSTGPGRVVPAHLVAYDFDTGFGLVQALGRLDVGWVPFGDSSAVAVGDTVVMAGCGGRRHALKARIVSKRSFAGYWEYLLEEALYTAPAHPNWGGTALLDTTGKLIGIGSLLVQQARGVGGQLDGNMSVPIDLIKPIFTDLVQTGRSPRPPRPWLGLYATEVEERLVVVGLVRNGPADRAGVQIGDIVVAVDDVEVADLEEMLRRIGALGSAGVQVPLVVLRDGRLRTALVSSANRNDFLKSPRLH